MTTHRIRIRIRLVLAMPLVALAGCASSTVAPATTTTPLLRVDPIALAEPTCPVTGEPVDCCSEAAYFESYPVRCHDRASARQFGSLGASQRARLASEQVLAQKGIANSLCPLTGEPLTAFASPALFEGEVVGFGSPALANQFRSLPEKSRAKVIAQWREEEAGLEQASEAAPEATPEATTK